MIAKRPDRQVIIAGDFNAKSAMWGATQTDARGRAVERWAAQIGLVLLNTGTTSTCVRRWGESIIDLTWATPAISRKVTNWRVAQELEALSDYRIITMEIDLVPPSIKRSIKRQQENRPRWAIKKLDEDILKAAIRVATWIGEWGGAQNVESKVAWLQRTLREICDAAMPRVRLSAKNAAYWWNENIAQLRKLTLRANRELARARR